MSRIPKRRILTLPAIHPCESVSPAALLHALIALCRDIAAHRSHAFPIHRRSARETIRQVGAILEFLDDIRDRGATLPGSVVVSFSELHVTLQKIRHLLHDCARRGTRLWLLMRSDRVSCDFRILIRSIATVLDVLPLESIDAAPEVKELIRLVKRQAWKAAIETDPADNRAVRSVGSMLSQFRNGVAPARSDLRRLLEHLHIRSWSDCNEEIAFLEEEIFASPDDDDDKVALLGSLMGFMVYCRVVLFDAMDGNRSDHKECKLQEEVIEHLYLEDLRCPISLELMTDPVTLATGQTYDRASIVRWFKAGYLTCPVTGKKLAGTELVPNVTIRKLVEQFCHSNNISITNASVQQKRDLARTVSPFSPAAAGAMRMAAAFLVDKLSNGPNLEKHRATYEIRKLSKSNLFYRACLVEADSIPWLLYLLSSGDPSIQEHAVAGLLNLSKHPQGRKAIFETGGLSLIVHVIKTGLKMDAKQNAAAVLFYLSSVEEYRVDIGEIPEAIPTLIGLLRDGAYRGKKNALVTLFGLLLHHGNHPKVLAAGAIPVLADLLQTKREDLVIDSVAVLATIAEKQEGTNAILRSAVIPHVVEVLRSTPSRSTRESCVSILLSLCNNGGSKVVSLLEKMPSLMPSLYSLVTEGSPQAGKKARSLLNHIHSFQEQGRHAILTQPIQDDIVHAQ
ncbi:U-box domain-containing protein 18 [Elaeis guineensis]|uniref:RING-type E3 ubiquitin transferase n=1 Tax=Elaeis guineensis var. tenera TaxID=51953 RepID=A0A6I9RUW0_ELAGV|nr:U-box domain-containing protein 18 [Elaeis guineensis]